MNDNSVFHLLIKVCRAHQKKTRELLEKIGLHWGQPPLLHVLWEKEGRTQTELCEILKISSATIAKMVCRMENEGFITKKVDREDRRVSRIYLTEKGREVREKVKEIERTVEEICVEGFTPEEKILLKRFLKDIGNNLNR